VEISRLPFFSPRPLIPGGRANSGIDRLTNGMVENQIRFDGKHQYELVIDNDRHRATTEGA